MSHTGINPELQRELDETKCSKITGYILIVLGTVLCIARLGLYIKIRTTFDAADIGAYWALLAVGLGLMTIGVIMLVYVRRTRAEILLRWQSRAYAAQPQDVNVQYFTPNVPTQYDPNSPCNYQPPSYPHPMPTNQEFKPNYMAPPPSYENAVRQ